MEAALYADDGKSEGCTYKVACAPTRAAVEPMAPTMRAVFMLRDVSEIGCVYQLARSGGER